jgi:hypothetical protein
VLEYAGGGGAASLENDGEGWIAQDGSTVEGPLYDCPGNRLATCGTTYGYRELNWRLSSLSKGGDGELTIVDEARDEKRSTCRRVVPFRAVLVNP